MKADYMEYARKCDKCQQFLPMSKAHPEELTSMASLWPFPVRGIDLIGRLPKGRSSIQRAVVAVNYFTKWVEEEALASITPTRISEFIYKSIIYWYGVPHTIVSDSGTKFECDKFKEFYDDLQIKKFFSSITQPQANG